MGEKRRLNINGSSVEVEILERARNRVRFLLSGRTFEAQFEEELHTPLTQKAAAPTVQTDPTKRPQARVKSSESVAEVTSPIPGLVTAILVAVGEKVLEGAPLLRVEAMKMENTIFASHSGRVKIIHTSQGQEVKDGQILLELDRI